MCVCSVSVRVCVCVCVCVWYVCVCVCVCGVSVVNMSTEWCVGHKRDIKNENTDVADEISFVLVTLYSATYLLCPLFISSV